MPDVLRREAIRLLCNGQRGYERAARHLFAIPCDLIQQHGGHLPRLLRGPAQYVPHRPLRSGGSAVQAGTGVGGRISSDPERIKRICGLRHGLWNPGGIGGIRQSSRPALCRCGSDFWRDRRLRFWLCLPVDLP